MTQKISFAKMHGLGNDFIIIDQNNLSANCNLELLAIQMADRRRGIGCDQFIIYNKSAILSSNIYEMIIYNQDGSFAKICGNAARCLTSLIYKKTGVKNISIIASEREIACSYLDSGLIRVNMGKVDFDKNWMPSNEQLWEIAQRYGVEPKEMICADIGNPHLVIFSEFSLKDKAIIGAKMQEHELFPGGINVNFAKVIDDKIELIVWERGAGFTLSCGSGACASFASAVKLGFIESTAQVLFELGILDMAMNGQDIVMIGPYTLVASGEFYVN